MVLPIKENFKTITFTVEEPISGLTGENMPATGEIIKCMVGVYSHGKMGENLKGNTSMIKSMDTENFSGLMEEFIRAIGRMESSMAMDFTKVQIVFRERVSGEMGKK